MASRWLSKTLPILSPPICAPHSWAEYHPLSCLCEWNLDKTRTTTRVYPVLPETPVTRSQSCYTIYGCDRASKYRSITTFGWVNQHPQPGSDGENFETPNPGGCRVRNLPKPQERLSDLSKGYSKSGWESSKTMGLLDWRYIWRNSSKLYHTGVVRLLGMGSRRIPIYCFVAQ